MAGSESVRRSAAEWRELENDVTVVQEAASYLHDCVTDLETQEKANAALEAERGQLAERVL